MYILKLLIEFISENLIESIQIDQPGANSGVKNRVVLPPGYRQFSEDNDSSNKTEENTDELSNGRPADDSVTHNLDTKESRKSPTKKKQNKDEKEKAKTRKIRTILQNYFMSRRRFFKMMESKMDRFAL